MYLNTELKDLVEPVALRAPLKKYDPKSLPDLIAWLETQPADRSYEWWNIGACLMCCYRLEACGIPRNNMGNAATSDSMYRDPFGPYEAGKPDGYGLVAGRQPYTMGAALERARSFLQATERSGS